MKTLLHSARLRFGRRPLVCASPLVAALFALSGCTDPQSAFHTAGAEAERVHTLFWVMTAGGTIIWLFTMGLTIFVTKIRPGAYGERLGVFLIIWGGCIFPVIVLSALVWYGTALMPDFRGPADGPRIAVSGERFWWRITYDTTAEPGVARALPRGDGAAESANELFLPVNRRTEILLGSPDVIHSFWVPSIAGKTDTIPGRINRLVLQPTKTGVFNGICAEFCGDAHAEMGFRVIVVPEDEYAAKVEAEKAAAAVTGHPGQELFMANGCNACHAVRGTPANGHVGPDLTHLGSRRTLAAGILPVNAETIARFVRDPGEVKQGAEMPAFAHLPEDEIRQIADWLGMLK